MGIKYILLEQSFKTSVRKIPNNRPGKLRCMTTIRSSSLLVGDGGILDDLKRR